MGENIIEYKRVFGGKRGVGDLEKGERKRKKEENPRKRKKKNTKKSFKEISQSR